MKIKSNREFILKVEKAERRLALSKSERIKEIDFEALVERCKVAKQKCFIENTDKGRDVRSKVYSHKLKRFL